MGLNQEQSSSMISALSGIIHYLDFDGRAQALEVLEKLKNGDCDMTDLVSVRISLEDHILKDDREEDEEMEARIREFIRLSYLDSITNNVINAVEVTR